MFDGLVENGLFYINEKIDEKLIHENEAILILRKSAI